MSRPLRWIVRVLLVLILLAAAAAVSAWLVLRASLPKLDGVRTIAGLVAEVQVERDALGVATIQAANRADAMRALGYVHAQERFFEMDLTRRVAAGELAELFGAAALPSDRANRVHRFRARSAAAVQALQGRERDEVAAYTAGVNAGLADLGARSFPYLLVGATPAPWRDEDAMLTGLAMFFDLQDEDNAAEIARGKLAKLAPPVLFDLLTAPGNEWDAPLRGEALPLPRLPKADELDLRTLDPKLFEGKVTVGGDFGLGSNNFGVAGNLSSSGAALVANDMHLGLRVPNIWFRARLKYRDDTAGEVDVTGATLPGVPSMVVGSNGRIAWGFTNSYGDWLDWVRVHWSNAEKTRYRTPDGDAELVVHDEIIKVKGAPDESLPVRETIWGPVLEDESDEVALALAWTAHRPGGIDFGLARLERAADVTSAVALAPTIGVPVQNLLVGDSAGHLAWTPIGRIPNRVGFDGRTPADWLEPGVGWNGWVDVARYPHVLDPENGRLWTANSRTVDGDWLALLGDGGYALGARAKQIRNRLIMRGRFDPKAMLDIQLDDQAIFMRWWWGVLRQAFYQNTDESLAEIDRLTQAWEPRASIDSRTYRLTRAFRLEVHRLVLNGLLAPLRAQDPAFRWDSFPQAEGVVWKIVFDRPMNLLPPQFKDWDELLRAAARTVVTQLGSQRGGLEARTWGERNVSAIRHPLSRAVPFLSRWLDMPARPLPGDSAMPRVQGPSFGASERFAVSPGHEAQGYFHMPGGQSGHPLSPFYGAGHGDWEEGKPTPFLPGATAHRLTLRAGG